MFLRPFFYNNNQGKVFTDITLILCDSFNGFRCTNYSLVQSKVCV